MSRYVKDSNGDWQLSAGMPQIDNELDATSENPVQNKAIVEGMSPIVNVLGAKNLLPNKATTQVVNGVTFTVNSDGSITANGQAGTGGAFIRFVDLYTDFSNSGIEPNIAYTISCKCSNPTITSDPSTYYATFEVRGAGTPYNGITTYEGVETGSFTKQELTSVNTYLQINEGFTANNYTFYPMIHPAGVQDSTYVPYAMTNRELTEEVSSLMKFHTYTGVAFSASGDAGITLPSDCTHPISCFIVEAWGTVSLYKVNSTWGFHSAELKNTTQSVCLIYI